MATLPSAETLALMRTQASVAFRRDWKSKRLDIAPADMLVILDAYQEIEALNESRRLATTVRYLGRPDGQPPIGLVQIDILSKRDGRLTLHEHPRFTARTPLGLRRQRTKWERTGRDRAFTADFRWADFYKAARTCEALYDWTKALVCRTGYWTEKAKPR